MLLKKGEDEGHQDGSKTSAESGWLRRTRSARVRSRSLCLDSIFRNRAGNKQRDKGKGIATLCRKVLKA